VINGAHVVIASTAPDADRAVLRYTLKLPHVDVGHGWLIFGMPPVEVAVHPSEENDVHEFLLMCADIHAFVAEMRRHGVETSTVQERLPAATCATGTNERRREHLTR
jgi:hypothetical protein